MKIEWDNLNKWLHFGDRFVLQFDNWFWLKAHPTIRQWELLSVMYDNGAWWSDLERSESSFPVMDGEKLDRAEVSVWSGMYPCFIQIMIFGVGFRFCFKRALTACSLRPTAADKENQA